MKPVTIKDIARALNISSSTVSRALKNSYKISEETILLVKEYAKNYNYKPNLNAQSLKSKKSRSIGILIPSISNNFFAEVISGIESIAQDRDYHVIITQSHESFETEKKILNHLIWRSVDGLLISLASGTTDISFIQSLQQQGIPIVFFDRITSLINTHRVASDNEEAAYKATIHMIKNGYKKIAHITSNQNISITQERLSGYKRALSDKKIKFNNDYVKYCNHSGMIFNEVEIALDDLLSMKNPPNGLLTAADRITIASLSVLKNKKIKIPDQMAVAGFSNFSSPDLFDPPLTTIKQPAFEIGKSAMELLLQLIESKRPVTEFQNKILPTDLIVRKSTEKC